MNQQKFRVKWNGHATIFQTKRENRPALGVEKQENQMNKSCAAIAHMHRDGWSASRFGCQAPGCVCLC